jgi:thioredoxin reductase (NADPH)
MFDALVIGSGPAGLSAAIYLARACRSVAVLDCGIPGRSDWGQTNRNYLGFPDGVSIVELCERGRRQAEGFGARFFDAEVIGLSRDRDQFVARTEEREFRAWAVVLATGVTDRWLDFPGYEACIGRSMHWCIVCDGFEMQGQRVLVVGVDEHAAELAIQMLGFTTQVSLLTNGAEPELSPESLAALDERGIPLIRGRITGARSRSHGYLETVVLETGEEIAVDHLFSAQGATPNSKLAAELGAELSSEGYIRVDTEARTSVPGLFAAGDVTRLFSHQVLTAAHEGATAASALDYLLYERDPAAQRAGCRPNEAASR